MSMPLPARHDAVLAIVKRAGRLAMRHFNRLDRLEISMKGRQDWLTAADGAVEAQVRGALGGLFPDDQVVGEEAGGRFGRRTWIIDPIDGTANFLRGDRHWCISLGLVEAGEPVFGILHAPALGDTFIGTAGSGATRNGKPIRASENGDMARAQIEFGWSTRRPVEEYLTRVASGFAAGASVKRCASGALGLASVACGRSDAYAESSINAWDVAAGIVIAREAGCRVSRFFDGARMPPAGPILCTAPGIAQAMSDLTGIRF